MCVGTLWSHHGEGDNAACFEAFVVLRSHVGVMAMYRSWMIVVIVAAVVAVVAVIMAIINVIIGQEPRVFNRSVFFRCVTNNTFIFMVVCVMELLVITFTFVIAGTAVTASAAMANAAEAATAAAVDSAGGAVVRRGTAAMEIPKRAAAACQSGLKIIMK